jgi:hypothetical protein
MPALLEQDADGAVVEHLRGFEAVVEDQEGVREGAAVVDRQSLAIDKHLQALLADAVVHEQSRDHRAVEGVVALAPAEDVDDGKVVA